MPVEERSPRFPLLLALATAALVAMPARAPAQTRPVDLEYQQNPAKRAADLAELEGLMAGIEKRYALVEQILEAGRKDVAAKGFVIVARDAGRLLVLYESLGFNFKNEKLGYPHYLIYKLESHLTGTKETRGPNGEITIGPEDPDGAKILVYAGVMGRPDQPPPAVDGEDVEKLHQAAAKIMGFLREKIFAANVPLE